MWAPGECSTSFRERFRIVVLTARSGDALRWSEEWLQLHDLPFDELAGSAEAKKSLHGVDALVDDYLGNIEDYLTMTPGPTVLVDQPWNRDGRDRLDAFVRGGRLRVVTALEEIPKSLAQLDLGSMQ
jgi:uncharacterized HAD superfamily protein